jgi:hypothetical protein
MFDKWKLSVFFSNLPPQRQIVLGLTFTALSLTTVIIYEETKIYNLEKNFVVERKAHKEIIKTKDSLFVAFQNRTFNFMEKELNTRFELKYEIKELKEDLKNKKK